MNQNCNIPEVKILIMVVYLCDREMLVFQVSKEKLDLKESL